LIDTLWIGDQQRGGREEDDQGERMVIKGREIERMCGRKRGEILEEVFYGGGKRERDPRRKEKERFDQKKRGDLGDQSTRKRKPWSKRT